jgi:hypothetical protein
VTAGSTRPPPSFGPVLASVGVLERNRTVGQRIARVLRAASPGEIVALESDPASLRAQLADEPKLIASDIADLDLLLDWAIHRYPTARLMVWSASDMTPLLEAASKHPALASIVAFPSFQSMPRPWELLLGARVALDAEHSVPRFSDLLGWGGTMVKYRPQTSRERDLVVAQLTSLTESLGLGARMAQKVADLSHELLMNAMYDAPVDQYGEARYAHDRTCEVSLLPSETPTIRFGFDGSMLAVQVSDPFGLLRRKHVLGGVLRARRAEHEDDVNRVLDTSGGGAGLGLHRVYSSSSAVIVRVVPGSESSVTALVDVEVNPREARNMPVSLHFL